MSLFHYDGSFNVPVKGNVLSSRAGSKFGVSPNLVNNVLNVLNCENDVYLYADDMLIIARERNIQPVRLSLQRKWMIYINGVHQIN